MQIIDNKFGRYLQFFLKRRGDGSRVAAVTKDGRIKADISFKNTRTNINTKINYNEDIESKNINEYIPTLFC